MRRLYLEAQTVTISLTKCYLHPVNGTPSHKEGGSPLFKL